MLEYLIKILHFWNIIPYSLYTGIRADLKGMNIIGLKRKGLKSNQINKIIKSVKFIFDSSNSIEINIKNLSDTFTKIIEIKEIIKFIEITKKRGICRYSND